MKKQLGDIVFVSIITSGGTEPRAIELCVVRTCKEFKEVARYDELIRPPYLIAESVTEETGITDSMVRNARTFDQQLPEITDAFLGASKVVWDKESRGSGALYAELVKIGCVCRFPWPRGSGDLALLGEPTNSTLPEVYTALFQKEVSAPKRAAERVAMIRECYVALVDRLYGNTESYTAFLDRLYGTTK